MLLQIRAALLHFDEHDGFPDVIGEGGAAAVLVGFADAELGRTADVKTAGLTKRLEEAVEEDLRLAFFVARDVLRAPGGELAQSVGIRHGRFLAELARRVSNDAWMDENRREGPPFAGRFGVPGPQGVIILLRMA